MAWPNFATMPHALLYHSFNFYSMKTDKNYLFQLPTFSTHWVKNAQLKFLLRCDTNTEHRMTPPTKTRTDGSSKIFPPSVRAAAICTLVMALLLKYTLTQCVLWGLILKKTFTAKLENFCRPLLWFHKLLTEILADLYRLL